MPGFGTNTRADRGALVRGSPQSGYKPAKKIKIPPPSANLPTAGFSAIFDPTLKNQVRVTVSGPAQCS